jgi:SAM-dependent methyltransferase
MAGGNSVWNSVRRLAGRVGLRNPFLRHKPSNWIQPNATKADIDYQIDYGIRNGELYAYRLKRMGIRPDARIMEIGPGVAFGGMAYLRAAGMSVAVSDRWLAPWSDAYHSRVYAGIADRLQGQPGFDVSPLRRMVAARGYGDDSVRCVFEAAERLADAGLGEFDAIVSNAVLEHVQGLDETLASLFRLTRSGGVGLHQVDFRDHRDFDRPLEHLFLKPEKFALVNERVHFEYGSRRRQPEYAEAMRHAGFDIETYEISERAKEAYLDRVVTRLGRRRNSTAAWNRDVLADLGGLFWLRKP